MSFPFVVYHAHLWYTAGERRELKFLIDFPFVFTTSGHADAPKIRFNSPADILTSPHAASFSAAVKGDYEKQLMKEYAQLRQCYFCSKPAIGLERCGGMLGTKELVQMHDWPIPYCERYSECEEEAGRLGRLHLESDAHTAVFGYSGLKSAPIVTRRSCRKCGTVNLVSRQCSGCKSATYCSKDCQLAAWPEHKASCKEMKRLKLETKARRAKEEAQQIGS